HFAVQEVELSIAMPRLGKLRPTVVGSLGRFDASRFSADRFTFLGAGLDLRYELTDRLRVGGGYRFEVRSFPQRASDEDILHLAELRLSYRPDPTIEVGVGSAYLSLAPAHAAMMDDGTLQVIRVGPDTEIVWGSVTLGLTLWGGTIKLAPA